MIELALNYVGLLVIYAIVLGFVGPERLALGMLPALVLVSVLLWYPFANRTHSGWSNGPEPERSHNYYGKLTFWLSLGLSMHRSHHLKPGLAWIELLDQVEEAPGWRSNLIDRVGYPRHD